jgi:hypothetical protein
MRHKHHKINNVNADKHSLFMLSAFFFFCYARVLYHEGSAKLLVQDLEESEMMQKALYYQKIKHRKGIVTG